MINYGTFPNKAGTWPAVTALNESSPGLYDGTPYNKDFIDDLWGANQALMSRAGLVPDGVPESASASQRMSALMRVLGYPGEVVMWWGNVDPATLGARILLCEGQKVLCSDYPDLVAATWVGASNNISDRYFYTSGAFMKYAAEGSTVSGLKVDGKWFKLPDARGKFLRDVSNGSGDNTQYDGKLPGFEQSEATLYHEHEIKTVADGTGDFYVAAQGETTPGGTYKVLYHDPARTSYALIGRGMYDSYGNSLSSKYSTIETRPVNIGCRIGIRY